MRVGMLGSKVIKGVLVDETLRWINIEICLIYGVCIGVCSAMNFEILRGTELKLGRE